MSEIIIWKFEKHTDCGFVVPEKRAANERDYFVSKKNAMWYKDWQRVKAKLLETNTWKRKEVKILELVRDEKAFKEEAWGKETIQWIFSGWNGKFWFIDVPWVEKWYFVHAKKKKDAQDGDLVIAKLQSYNWKTEAIILEVLEKPQNFVVWKFTDHETFWFVVAEIEWIRKDIFIPWNNMWEAENGDVVKVLIVKETGKNPQWVIVEVLEENEDLDDETAGDDLDFELTNS